MGDLQDQALTAFRSAEATLQKVSGAAHRGELHRDPKAVGVFLAFSSSAFIGASFVITRKALQRAAARGGKRAGEGGYAYFSEPLWWVGTLTMVVGEIANFSAYAFAPAILVTPLGAISIIISAILAHYHLAERLHICGLLGCFWCVPMSRNEADMAAGRHGPSGGLAQAGPGWPRRAQAGPGGPRRAEAQGSLGRDLALRAAGLERASWPTAAPARSRYRCVVGSFVLVSFAPEEQIVNSVEEIWEMATQPTSSLTRTRTPTPTVILTRTRTLSLTRRP